MILSPKQKDIYDFCLHSDKNLILNAAPGAGKSTTIVHSIIPALIEKGIKPEEINVLMFGKPIQKEFREKVDAAGFPQVQVSTFHSMGYSMMRQKFKSTTDFDKLKKIGVKYEIKDYEVYRLISLAKNFGFGIIRKGSLEDIAEAFNIELSGEEIEAAEEMLEESNEITKTIDFSDMIYGPVLHRLKAPKYKAILIDEAQDFTDLMVEFLGLALNDARLIAVGDRYQSIFGFAGSSMDSMQEMQNRFKCAPLPLDVTFRCARSIVRKAREIFPEVEARPEAPEGIVSHLEYDSFINTKFDESCAILCRTNAPLVNLYFSLLARGVKGWVQGRDIAQETINITKKWKSKDLTDLEKKVCKWVDRQEKKLCPKNTRAFQTIKDKSEIILSCIKKCLYAGKNTKGDLESLLTSIFSEKGEGVVLSSVHKFKGKEKQKVFILNWDLMPASWAKNEFEEECVRYVAVTRAINELYLVPSQPNEPKKEIKKQGTFPKHGSIVENDYHDLSLVHDEVQFS